MDYIYLFKKKKERKRPACLKNISGMKVKERLRDCPD